MSKSGFFWNDKKSKFSLIVEQRFRNTSSKPIITDEVSQNWIELSSLNEVRLIMLVQETNDVDKIINLFMNSCWSKIGIFVKLMRKASVTWKNWSAFKAQHSRQLRGENWSKIKIPSCYSLARYKKCKMKSIVWMILEFFKMLNQYEVDKTTLPVNLRFSHLFQNPGGMLSRSIGMPSRKNWPPSIWDTHVYRETFFANPTASSSAPYPQESNPWIPNVSEHISPHVMSESQTPVQDQRCQSGPSTRNSVIPSEGRFSKDYGTDQPRLQMSDPHFDKLATPATFACWKIRFKTEVCTCSQFPTEAMHWIKEVEMVDSVDDLKSSCSVRGIRMPDFEVLDAKIASALNRIIHNSHLKRRVSLEEEKAKKRGPFPSWKTDRLLDLRVLPSHCSQWFCRELCRLVTIVFEMMIFRNSIQNGTEIWYQWRKSHLTTYWKVCTN